MITLFTPLLTIGSLILTRVSRQLIIRLNLFCEMSTDWILNLVFYANPLLQKTLNLILQRAARALTDEPE